MDKSPTLHQPSLDDVEIFVEVARAKSFTKAGENLEIPNGTVSRRISSLEKQLGVRLFDRNTRRVTLTPHAERYFERCAHLIDEMRICHEALRHTTDFSGGKVSISLPVDFGIHWLAPIIGEFSRVYPAIKLNIDLSPHPIDFLAERIDISIRIGQINSVQLIGIELESIEMGLYAAPSYLRTYGYVRSHLDLPKHQCIHLLKNKTWHMDLGGESYEIPVDAYIASNNMGLMLKLAKDALGIAFLPRKLAAQAENDGELTEVLSNYKVAALPVNALISSRTQPMAVKVFLRFLKERFSQTNRHTQYISNSKDKLSNQGEGIFAFDRD